MLTRKQKGIIKKVHDFVEKESEDFSEVDIFKSHILPVKDFAVKLSSFYKANTFVVTVAAYLHDIYYIQTRNHEIHETQGAVFARRFLKRLDADNEDIELIAKCILNHRGNKGYKRDTIEEKIVACSDGMSHIDNALNMFYLISKEMDYSHAMEWIRRKMQKAYKKLELKKARELIKPKYLAIKKVIKER